MKIKSKSSVTSLWADAFLGEIPTYVDTKKKTNVFILTYNEPLGYSKDFTESNDHLSLQMLTGNKTHFNKESVIESFFQKVDEKVEENSNEVFLVYPESNAHAEAIDYVKFLRKKHPDMLVFFVVCDSHLFQKEQNLLPLVKSKAITSLVVVPQCGGALVKMSQIVDKIIESW